MQIFVSYSASETKDFALDLKTGLGLLPNVAVWMDESLESGKSWGLQIQDEIDQCDVMIVLLSPDVNRPKTIDQDYSFVLKEISYAQGLHKPIIPVMVKSTSLPLQLADLQYIDLRIDPEDKIRELIQEIYSMMQVAGSETDKALTASQVLGKATDVIRFTKGSLERVQTSDSNTLLVRGKPSQSSIWEIKIGGHSCVQVSTTIIVGLVILFFSISYLFDWLSDDDLQGTAGAQDRDNDTVVDEQDHCPDEAGDPNLAGCPDEDSDGVPNIDDACPADPNDAVGDPCNHDEDGDGILDLDDACPNQANDSIGDPCDPNDNVGPRETTTKTS